MRNLIVCADGTWNTPEQETGGVPRPTNVVRLFNALAETGASGEPQQAYYHPGVGTEGSRLRRLAGGAVGSGLGKNVLSGYRWLADTYQPGDRIFLFGFSRGAYTVRSLAGMITRYGLIETGPMSDHAAWAAIERVYQRGYREGRVRCSAWADGLAFHRQADGAEAREVHFLGVWDTVGALGIPDNYAILNLLDDSRRYRFHDTALNDRVRNARHAVALDEPRASFAPTLWTNVGGRQTVEQLWFPGNHGDVGGGHLETGLSDGALQWMLEEARALGLGVDKRMSEQISPDARGLLHDSLRGVWRPLYHQPRSAPAMIDANQGAPVHPSALARQQQPPITQTPYRPTRILGIGERETVDVFARERWNATGLYLEAGASYRFAASGEWLDASIPCSPAGNCRPHTLTGSLAHGLGSLIGRAEGLFARITGNRRANLIGSRRVETAPWLALIGVVANAPPPPDDGSPVAHETITIGAGTDATVERGPGYLYCFANDAWRFYGNNRGHVQLEVERIE